MGNNRKVAFALVPVAWRQEVRAPVVCVNTFRLFGLWKTDKLVPMDVHSVPMDVHSAGLHAEFLGDFLPGVLTPPTNLCGEMKTASLYASALFTLRKKNKWEDSGFNHF